MGDRCVGHFICLEAVKTRLVDGLGGVVGQHAVEVESDAQAAVLRVVSEGGLKNSAGRQALVHGFEDIRLVCGEKKRHVEGWHELVGRLALHEDRLADG